MQWMDRARGQGHWTLNGGWSVLAHCDFPLHPPIAASVSHVAYPLICTASSVMLTSTVDTHEGRQPASVGTLDKLREAWRGYRIPTPTPKKHRIYIT